MRVPRSLAVAALCLFLPAVCLTHSSDSFVGSSLQPDNDVSAAMLAGYDSATQLIAADEADLKSRRDINAQASLEEVQRLKKRGSTSSSRGSEANEVPGYACGLALEELERLKGCLLQKGDCKNGAAFNEAECKCECSGDWSGEECDKCEKECSGDGESLNTEACKCNKCSLKEAECEHGAAFNAEDCQCECLHGWSGRTCGECNLKCDSPEKLDEAACMCKPNGDGDECEKTCQHGGTLKEDACKCECSGDWGGEECDKCDLHCKNDGEVLQQDCACRCKNPWTGNNCEECDMNNATFCKHGKLTKDQCACECEGGWENERCDTCNIDCKNGGTRDLESCRCNCAHGFSGNDCSEKFDSESCTPSAIWKSEYNDETMPEDQAFSSECVDVVVNICTAMNKKEKKVTNTFFYRGCMVVACENHRGNTRMTISRDPSRSEAQCRDMPEYAACPESLKDTAECKALAESSKKPTTRVLWKAMMCRAYDNTIGIKPAKVHECDSIKKHLTKTGNEMSYKDLPLHAYESIGLGVTADMVEHASYEGKTQRFVVEVDPLKMQHVVVPGARRVLSGRGTVEYMRGLKDARRNGVEDHKGDGEDDGEDDSTAA